MTGLVPHQLATLLVLLHFLGDIGAQWPALAAAKGESIEGLLLHILLYGAVALVPLMVMFGGPAGDFVLVNLFAHLCVDAVTARVGGRLRERSEFWFWKLIALDQFLHIGFLMWTMPLLYST